MKLAKHANTRAHSDVEALIARTMSPPGAVRTACPRAPAPDWHARMVLGSQAEVTPPEQSK